MARNGLSSGSPPPSPAPREHAAPRKDDEYSRLRAEIVRLRAELTELRAVMAAREEFISIAAPPMAELVVRDHGIGIAQNDLERIFVRFERAGAQQRGGLGVGLWLVDKLCAAMGGTVHVESCVGVGSTFTVRLPEGRS